MSESTELALDQDAFIDILCRAASKDRTVVEFRTTTDDEGNRALDHAMEITDHVTELEEMVEE